MMENSLHILNTLFNNKSIPTFITVSASNLNSVIIIKNDKRLLHLCYLINSIMWHLYHDMNIIAQLTRASLMYKTNGDNVKPDSIECFR